MDVPCNLIQLRDFEVGFILDLLNLRQREMQNRNIWIVEWNFENESLNHRSGGEQNRRQRAVFWEMLQ